MSELLDNYIFEALANASDNVFLYVTDMKEDLTRWSKNAVKFFNLESEYTVNTAEYWMERIHPNDRDVYYEDISAVLLGESAHHNCQYRVKNRYGEYMWVDCRGSVSFDENGDPAVFAGIMTWLDNQGKYDNLTHVLTSYELLRYPLEESGALMLVGIDRFKEINNQHGILYGNRILVKLAKILKKEAKGCNVYRLQGDEFVVSGMGLTSQDMTAVFRRIQKACKTFDLVEGLNGFSVSAGITEYEQTDIVPDVLSRASLILSHAKENSANHIALYSTAIKQQQMRKNLISQELMSCIEDECRDFYLVYQPIYDTEGKKMIGCEALLRWKTENKEIGTCGPGEFIPILEANGGITDIGYFVVDEVMKQAMIWQQKKDMKISFNISYLQLEDARFIPYIIEAIQNYKVDPSMIVVELTESIYASDMYLVSQAFDTLKSHGIWVTLDDFGNGSSSFGALHNLKIDCVKLDQALVRGLAQEDADVNMAVIESIALLCQRIGCNVIAEGIETEEILEKLRQFSFRGLQGYLFARPMEVEAIEKMIDSDC